MALLLQLDNDRAPHSWIFPHCLILQQLPLKHPVSCKSAGKSTAAARRS